MGSCKIKQHHEDWKNKKCEDPKNEMVIKSDQPNEQCKYQTTTQIYCYFFHWNQLVDVVI